MRKLWVRFPHVVAVNPEWFDLTWPHVFINVAAENDLASVIIPVASTEYCVHTVFDQNVLPLATRQQGGSHSPGG